VVYELAQPSKEAPLRTVEPVQSLLPKVSGSFTAAIQFALQGAVAARAAGLCYIMAANEIDSIFTRYDASG
jgi:hypothetical protein